MQVKKRYPGWLTPVLFAVALATAIVLSGLNAPTGPEGGPLVNSPDTYNRVVNETLELVAGPFAIGDAGGDLSADDVAALRKAAPMFESLNAYQPTNVNLFLGAAKAYAYTGEDERAEERILQLLNNAPLYHKNDLGNISVMDAKFVLSGIRFRQGRFAEAYAFADEAVKALPNLPPDQLEPNAAHYLAARASAAIQLKLLDQARRDVLRALQIEPEHTLARKLALLLGAKG